MFTIKNSLVEIVHEEDNEESKLDPLGMNIKEHYDEVKVVESSRHIPLRREEQKEKIDEVFSEDLSVPDENEEEMKDDLSSDSDE